MLRFSKFKDPQLALIIKILSDWGANQKTIKSITAPYREKTNYQFILKYAG